MVANLYWGDSITMAAGSVGTCTGTANCVTAGAGGSGNSGSGNGTNGTAYATDIFLFQNSALTFNGSASSQTINAAIQADQNTPTTPAPPIILDRGIVVGLGSATSTIVLNSANNSYRGGTNLTQGILSISADSNLGTAPTSAITNITFNGGTLANTSNVALNVNRTILANAAGTFAPASGTTLTISGTDQITGNGAITINGSGGTVLLSANNAYTGTTYITAGTLAAGTVNAFSPNSAVVLANSSLASMALSGHNQTIGSLSGGGSAGGNIVLGTSELFINQNANGLYAGAFSTGGAVQLTSASTATLTLTNANTNLTNAVFYVLGGTLAIGTNTTLGSGSILYMDGGAFQASVPLLSAIANAYDVAANSTFNGSNNFTISGAGNLGTATFNCGEY